MWFFGKKKKEKKVKDEVEAVESVKASKEEKVGAKEEKVETVAEEKFPETGKTEAKAKRNNTNEAETKISTNTERKETVKDETKQRTAPTKKVYHVSLRKDDGKWQVKYGGGKKAIKLFDTQAEAIKFAEERAESQEGSMSIHKKDGKIRKQDYSKKTEIKVEEKSEEIEENN